MIKVHLKFKYTSPIGIDHNVFCYEYNLEAHDYSQTINTLTNR